MDHGPAADPGQDNATDVKARIGFVLFIVYGLVYAGFVVINTISPKTMGETIFLDLNLAVIYGFGLIILAIVMGLIYNAICSRYEKQLNTPEGEES